MATHSHKENRNRSLGRNLWREASTEVEQPVFCSPPHILSQGITHLFLCLTSVARAQLSTYYYFTPPNFLALLIYLLLSQISAEELFNLHLFTPCFVLHILSSILKVFFRAPGNHFLFRKQDNSLRSFKLLHSTMEVTKCVL